VGLPPHHPDKRSALDRFFCKRICACLQSFGQTFLKVGEVAVYRNGFGATPQGFNVLVVIDYIYKV